jgi:phosphate transport system substrate-binding protein
MKQKFSVIALLAVLAALTAFGGVARPSTAAQATAAATVGAAATMAGTMAAETAAPIPGSGLVAAADSAEAKTLTASGATFPQDLYRAWFAQYKTVTGVEVTYGGGGSGKGKTDLFAGTVDFAGTDAFVTEKEFTDNKLTGEDIVHIPTALGAVVLIYNVPEAKTQIKLTADNIAEIFSLKIVKWNDAKLVANNPELKEVNKDIVVVRRADSSGTTSIFTNYLSAANADWKATLGAGSTVKWAAETIGGQGNDGVAGQVKQNSYAIGYVELLYARKNKLGFAEVRNAAGKFINPSLQGVTDAAAGFLADTPADLRKNIVNATGDTSYPISGYTWIIVKTKQTDAAKARAIARLLWWATHDGQAYNAGLDFAPLPLDIIKRAEQLIVKINVDGKAALPEDIAKTVAAAPAMMATMAATAAK